MTKLKAWVKYDSNDRLIASVLVLRNKKPAGEGWVEVNRTLCCSGDTPVAGKSQDRLRAFIKYSNNGNVVPSSLIIRKTRPSGKNWVEISYNRYCIFNPEDNE